MVIPTTKTLYITVQNEHKGHSWCKWLNILPEKLYRRRLHLQLVSWYHDWPLRFAQLQTKGSDVATIYKITILKFTQGLHQQEYTIQIVFTIPFWMHILILSIKARKITFHVYPIFRHRYRLPMGFKRFFSVFTGVQIIKSIEKLKWKGYGVLQTTNKLEGHNEEKKLVSGKRKVKINIKIELSKDKNVIRLTFVDIE